MGKTSLLRYLQRQYRKGKGLLPLFWDVAGANSAYDLKLSFLDCLEAGIADFERNGIEPDIEKLLKNVMKYEEEEGDGKFS